MRAQHGRGVTHAASRPTEPRPLAPSRPAARTVCVHASCINPIVCVQFNIKSLDGREFWCGHFNTKGEFKNIRKSGVVATSTVSRAMADHGGQGSEGEKAPAQARAAAVNDTRPGAGVPLHTTCLCLTWHAALALRSFCAQGRKLLGPQPHGIVDSIDTSAAPKLIHCCPSTGSKADECEVSPGGNVSAPTPPTLKHLHIPRLAGQALRPHTASRGARCAVRPHFSACSHSERAPLRSWHPNARSRTVPLRFCCTLLDVPNPNHAGVPRQHHRVIGQLQRLRGDQHRAPGRSR